MPDLDLLLRHLGEEAAPDQLSSIEARVLNRVSGHSFEQEPLRYRVGAVTLALLMGVAGGMLPEGGRSGNDPVAPFGEAANLAPSTLLVGS
ncbi:MAG: hypothetical protein ACK4SZ_14095 [Allosphingosinicella sp.]|uniref:hypothetical protein n=1 Tax=Allosphingosinicella sp. TaxID=2823234 RepID=UPI003950AD9D